MSCVRLIATIFLGGHLILTAAVNDPGSPAEGGPNPLPPTISPVLRRLEPVDSGHIVLPGPPAPAIPPATRPRLEGIPPVAKMARLPVKLTEDPLLRQPLPRVAVNPPATAPKPSLPPDLEREIAVYCQKQIGHWSESDARAFLGRPLRQRPAFDERKAVNGTIYSFADPTGRYKDLELDFDRSNGTLRTVFVYPPRLSWQDCRRQWPGPFTSADARQGRTFYSYTNRRLDVLVDAAGKVVSLGWY